MEQNETPGKDVTRPTVRPVTGVPNLERSSDAQILSEKWPGDPGGGRFTVKYYLTAMLFIVFDIEIIFLYPWAVHFDALGLFGLIAMVLFLVNVSIAYAYEWRRGGLEWD